MQLRREPIENLIWASVENMLKTNNFFEKNRNCDGIGYKHVYELKEQANIKLVVDYATDLIWQQSGAEREMEFGEAQSFLKWLNSTSFAGSSQWRLPTLEESISLSDPLKNENDLHIDTIFDPMQKVIWTADMEDISYAWYVDFELGICDTRFVNNFNFVRALTDL
ncbi:MAG: Lcl C-terminal domain-containing protein [Candidatus Kariarchaeaceae archaeon]